jgi:hypothetical protein
LEYCSKTIQGWSSKLATEPPTMRLDVLAPQDSIPGNKDVLLGFSRGQQTYFEKYILNCDI